MISYEILQTVSGERLISSIIWDTITIMTKRRSKSAWTGAQSLNLTLAINNKCIRVQKVFQNFVVKYLEKKINMVFYRIKGIVTTKSEDHSLSASDGTQTSKIVRAHCCLL